MLDAPSLTRKTLRFLLDDKLVELEGFVPHMTVLQFLRDLADLCGTKEGCTEGDCGACTVAVGELVDGSVRYRAVNACIQLVATLDGKQLRTVEREADGKQGELLERMEAQLSAKVAAVSAALQLDVEAARQRECEAVERLHRMQEQLATAPSHAALTELEEALAAPPALKSVNRRRRRAAWATPRMKRPRGVRRARSERAPVPDESSTRVGKSVRLVHL